MRSPSTGNLVATQRTIASMKRTSGPALSPAGMVASYHGSQTRPSVPVVVQLVPFWLHVRTGTIKAYEELRVVLRRCFDAGVSIAICTDNSGMHQVRLPMELENLLVRDIIDFHQMKACHEAAFEHAFGWEGPAREL